MSAIIPFNEIENMALAVSKSKLFGVNTPEQAMSLMILCQAEGLHPGIAMRDYHIIQGRPALKADAMLARFQQAGGKVDWKEYTNDKVTGVFSHPQGGSLEVSWSLAQAKAIGIANKDNWKNYPRAMLRARVVSEGIRSVYPGCVVGVYTPEEVQDFAPSSPAPAKDMGMAERVEDVPATEIPDIQEADGAFKLYLPNSEEPYAAFHTKEEWVSGYAQMVFKIFNSPKFTEEAKEEKIAMLDKSNTEMLAKLDSFQKLKLRTELIAMGVPQGPKASKSPSSAEQEHNEKTS
jgi:hypothetical protein